MVDGNALLRGDRRERPARAAGSLAVASGTGLLPGGQPLFAPQPRAGAAGGLAGGLAVEQLRGVF